MSNNFRYQAFVAVSRNVGGKVPVVDNVLSSNEKQTFSTTSLDENRTEFEFQTDRNYDVDLRQTYLASKLKFVVCRGYETYKTKKTEKSTKKRQKWMKKRRRRRSKRLQFLL